MKKLTLMRGLSGSGKSKMAHEILETGGLIISTDDFWCDEYGNYKFDYTRIEEAHEDARERVHDFMHAECPHIIVDNTNARWWEMYPYLTMAKHHGYSIETVMAGGLEEEDIAEYAARNVHNVPIDIIKRQAKNFERLMDPEAGYHLEKLRQSIEKELKEG